MIFSKWCWQTWIIICRTKLNPYNSPCTKINSKWIKELNMKPETLKVIEEKVGSNLKDIGVGKDFLNQRAASQEIRSTADKWDLMKLFCTGKKKQLLYSKRKIKEVNRKSTE